MMSNTPIPIINFRTNSDFPASKLPASMCMELADHLVPFDDAEYSSCTLLKGRAERVLIPWDDHLAKEMDYAPCVTHDGVDYMVGTIEDGGLLVPHHHQSGGRAYWLQSKLHNAIYGQVRYGTVLQKIHEPLQVMLPPPPSNDASSSSSKEPEWTSVKLIKWMATTEAVAIKEMSWEHIRSQGAQLAEDPIKEVGAMQYLQNWVNANANHQGLSADDPHRDITPENNHIMMLMDLLSDDDHLYSITPFAKHGRLLDIIEGKSRFSEPEARYWMRQILTGLAVLKNAGVTHRDMSPEIAW